MRESISSLLHSSFLIPKSHQLAFLTPGIIPDSARSRKQMRQMPNFRRYARERPQR